VVVIVEPALKLQSRKLLELRQEILSRKDRRKIPELQILLPCLGHQACGAFAAEGDWCHEEVAWWRPPYLREIDKMAGLDRKTLPFSYLVLTRSKRPIEELLPALRGTTPGERYRLVSPGHSEGRDREFYVCGEDGKRRARLRPEEGDEAAAEINRGDLLLGAEVRGDAQSSRVQSVKKIG
jgi:hypothetical protein